MSLFRDGKKVSIATGLVNGPLANRPTNPQPGDIFASTDVPVTYWICFVANAWIEVSIIE